MNVLAVVASKLSPQGENFKGNLRDFIQDQVPKNTFMDNVDSELKENYIANYGENLNATHLDALNVGIKNEEQSPYLVDMITKLISSATTPTTSGETSLRYGRNKF